MKIIGKTSDGFVLTADDREIARLIGFYWPGDEGFPRDGLKIGDDIALHAMYEQLYELARRRDALATVAKDIRALADLLEVRNPVIASATHSEPSAAKGGA